VFDAMDVTIELNAGIFASSSTFVKEAKKDIGINQQNVSNIIVAATTWD
jgi:hypothetical protein